jgi:AraC-like DNA-binding protein
MIRAFIAGLAPRIPLPPSPRRQSPPMSAAAFCLIEAADADAVVRLHSEFRVEDLARRVGKSKSQLYRTLTSLTGCSPKELVNDFRLRKASELLEARRGNVSEVAFEAGFSSAAHFSKSFQDRFGILPSMFLKAAR